MTTRQSSSRRLRSDVWKYFDKVGTGSKSVTCKVCKQKFAFHGGTTNLRDHLQRTHGAVYVPESAGCSGQKKIESALKVQRCSAERTKILDNLIVGLAVKDLRPTRIVEGEGFRKLMEYCEPGYTVLSRKHFGKLMLERYMKGKALLAERLQVDALSLSVTTDIWTSSSTEAYISLTCHFLTSQWEFVDCILAAKCLPGHHTGENISATIMEVLTSYEIPESSVSSIVHDQGSNMRRASDLLYNEKGWNSICCSAHMLQLCISDGFKSTTSIDRALGAARKLVGHFHHSTLATAELYKKQLQMDKDKQKLKIDCSTRWNSTLYMIQRLVTNRWPVSAVLSDTTVTKRQDRTLDLTAQQWVLLEELAKLLEPLEIATVLFCTEKKVSISCVLPVMHSVATSMGCEEGDSPSIIAFKTAVVESIMRRWSLDGIESNSPLVLAAALDPRFKSLRFLTDDLKQLVKEEISQLKELQLGNPTFTATVEEEMILQSPPAKKQKQTALDILLGDDDCEGTSKSDTELEEFMLEKPIPHNSDIMAWWRANEQRFPKLAKLAKVYLGIPATSASSERVFSKAGIITAKQRNCLKAKNVEAIIF